MTGSPAPEHSGESGSDSVTAPSRFSMRRVVPAPWVDCRGCGWRHYPDTSRRQGPQIPSACSNCGETLAVTVDASGELGGGDAVGGGAGAD